MNFEVNGVGYLFTFDTNAAQWLLLTSSHGAVESMEIHSDGTPRTTPVVLMPYDGSAPQ